MSAILSDFIDGYAARGLILDDFQVDSCRAIDSGRDILLSAPTGSGKTVVAHYAVTLALAEEKRCVYTAPIKALTNQKYAELVEIHGEEYVGLLTGDVTINREAQILVVTTEVLRNMIFANSEDLADIGYVVLDEIHYLADRERGPVWEEIILTLPSHARLVSLSATIANTRELLGWLTSIRGDTALVVSEHRPVPLEQHVSVGRRLFPLYGKHDGEPHGAMVSAVAGMQYEPGARLSDAGRRRIISQLDSHDMLPAIEFIFSRKGCDLAVQALMRRDITLTSASERARIRERVQELRATLTPSDRRAINFEGSVAALERGYGAHHAGIFPGIKSLTEKLMEEGLLKLVYATGTLALGIDMPVRSVVVESLRRWDGDGFVDLTATEYTQLIGRAGRRGRDTYGHALIVATPDFDPYHVATLGSGRLEPLMSAFVPSYNTVVNLLAEQSYEGARGIIARSFAQYQRNADLVELEQRLVKIRAAITRAEAELNCDRGDVVDFLRKRASSGRAAKSIRKAAKREYRERIADSFAGARNGRVYAVHRAGELDYVLVLSTSPEKIRVIDWYGEISWLREDALGSELRDVGAVPIPPGRSLKDRATREDLADAIADEVEERTELGLDRDLLDSWARFAVRDQPGVVDHPCAACPEVDDHIRAGEGLLSLDAREHELMELSAGYTDSVGREFDATVAVLRHIGIIQGDDSSPRMGPGAAILRNLHTDNDLLAYTCLSALREGEISPAEFAGWASIFMADDRLGTRPPREGTLASLTRTAAAESEFLRSLEFRHGIERTKDLSPGCAEVFRGWAEGASLEACLDQSRLPAGDFINAARRLIDLLGQMIVAGESTWIEDVARTARDLVRRREVLV